MSGLVKRDIIKVMSMTNFPDSALDSAASTLDVCSSAQIHCSSASDHL